MSTFAWSALGLYGFGVAVFLTFYRHKVLGGWVQTLFTALIWPVLSAAIVYEINKKDSL